MVARREGVTGEAPEGVSRAEVSWAATRAVMKAEVKEAAVRGAAAAREVIKARSSRQTASMRSMPLETSHKLRLVPWRSRRTRDMLVTSRCWGTDCKASRVVARGAPRALRLQIRSTLCHRP